LEKNGATNANFKKFNKTIVIFIMMNSEKKLTKKNEEERNKRMQKL